MVHQSAHSFASFKCGLKSEQLASTYATPDSSVPPQGMQSPGFFVKLLLRFQAQNQTPTLRLIVIMLVYLRIN